MLRILCLAYVLVISSSLGFANSARFGLAPDNSKAFLLSTLDSAKQTLVINIYEFNDSNIADALIQKVRKGIAVQILIEANPFAFKSEGRKIVEDLKKAMKKAGNSKNRLFLMDKPEDRRSRRFKLDHAKYLIVDGQSVMISSENFSEKALPAEGRSGNRGWHVVLNDRTMAKQLLTIFESDSDPSHGDVIDALATELPTLGSQAQNFQQTEGRPIHIEEIRTVPTISEGKGQVTEASLITSPDSLSSLVKLIRSAHKTLDVEFLSLPSLWRSPKEGQSPLIAEMIEASRRGVTVRALLNDERVFQYQEIENPGGQYRFLSAPDSNKSKTFPNHVTSKLLQKIAECEGLSLSAKVVDVKDLDITYIHNKGMLVDGKRTLVSSVNGTQASVMQNREVGILLEGQDPAEYYGAAFDFDWNHSSDATMKSLARPKCSMLLSEESNLRLDSIFLLGSAFEQ